MDLYNFDNYEWMKVTWNENGEVKEKTVYSLIEYKQLQVEFVLKDITMHHCEVKFKVPEIETNN